MSETDTPTSGRAVTVDTASPPRLDELATRRLSTVASSFETNLEKNPPVAANPGKTARDISPVGDPPRISALARREFFGDTRRLNRLATL